MKLLISKFSSVLPLTAICSLQKITNANSNREINGGSEDLIDSGDHSRAQTYDKRVVPAININFWNFGLFQHIVKFNFSNNCPNQK